MRSFPTFYARLSALALAAVTASCPALAASPPAERAASVAAGEKRFNQNCVYCHGNAGSGGKGAALQGRSDLTADYLFHTISNGKTRGSLLMPAWKDAFSEDEIRELASYILSLRDVGAKK